MNVDKSKDISGALELSMDATHAAEIKLREQIWRNENCAERFCDNAAEVKLLLAEIIKLREIRERQASMIRSLQMTIEEYEDQDSFGYLCADGVKINPENHKVYFYPKWATDGIPCFGLLEFNNDSREWWPYHGEQSGPAFSYMKAVKEYIEKKAIN